MTKIEKMALTYFNPHELGDQAAWFTACSKMAEEVIKARREMKGDKISQTSISPRPNPYVRLLKAVKGIVAHEFPVSIGFDSSRERWNELAEALEYAYDDLVQKAVSTSSSHNHERESRTSMNGINKKLYEAACSAHAQIVYLHEKFNSTRSGEAVLSLLDDAIRSYEQLQIIATGKTHWEGCWKLHLPCAIERVNQLEGTLNRIAIYTESLPKKGEENV